MRKTVETMNMSKETELFNNAIDYFFGMNPAKRHWILLALYLAKNKKLTVIDNYAGDGFVMAQLDFDLVEISNPQKAEDWKQKGIHYRSIVATVVGEERVFIEDIYNSFDQNRPDDPNMGFFGKRRMEPDYLIGIAKNLISLSDEWYRQNTKWAIDSIMKKMIDYDHLVCKHYQPQKLTELALTLLDAKDGSVYNPYAGICSYGVDLNPNCRYYGQELSDWNIIGNLNLLINDRENAVIKKEDSVSSWVGDNYDYIIATPSFRCECDSPYKYTDLDFFVRSSEDTNKKAIGIYPLYLGYGTQFNINQPVIKIVDNDWIESVILLPQGVIKSTGIFPLMIVVNKNKSHKGYVRFINATNCFELEGRSKILSVEEIVKLANDPQANDVNSLDVNIKVIKDNEYVLSPEYYLANDAIDVPQGFEIHTISEYLSTLKLKIFKGKTGKVFQPHQNSDIINKCTIFAEDLKETTLNAKNNKSVNHDCVILRFMNKLELFHLVCNGENIILPPFYCAFEIAADQLEPLYLSTEIQKDYVTSQIDKIKSIRGGISSITSKDFLGLKILIPTDKSQQLSLVSKSKVSTIEALESELKLKFKKQLDSFEKNQRQRKHAVAQVLNEIEPSIELIEQFILNNKSVTKDSVVSRRFGTTLQEYIYSMRKQIEKVVNMVDSFTNREEFGEAESICLKDFLSEYCQVKRSMQIDVADIMYEEDFDLKVRISKKDLAQMLDNLISNATKYGIPKNHSKDYKEETNSKVKIRIECSKNEDNFVDIRVTNNGEPVSKSIAIEQLFTWGIGQGTGIGCYQVKEIAKHFGGDVSYKEYINDPDGFFCEFDIVLPLNKD